MQPGASNADVEAVVGRVQAAGGEAFVSRGVSRTIIGLVGDVDEFRAMNLRAMTGVADVIRVSAPYKLVSLHNQPGRTTVVVGGPDLGVPIGPDTFTLIAGPCAVESAQQTREAAEMAKAAGASLLRGGAFKPRTSPYAFQGLGSKGLEILAEAREETGLPIVTELLDPRDVAEVAEIADVIQIGARNMQNFNLLAEVGRVPKPVLLKRSPAATVEELLVEVPAVNVMLGDACEPWVLEAAELSHADVVVAATGDDEDNLVTSPLAKQAFPVPRVLPPVTPPHT